MPEGFVWCEVDIQDATQRLEAYNLLNDNYVEDDDSTFRSLHLIIRIVPFKRITLLFSA